MAKLTVMWITVGGSVSTEVENLNDFDWVRAEMEKRGLFLFETSATGSRLPKDNTRELADYQEEEDEEIDFCPKHGSGKKWADTKDGGHYCGFKNEDNSWCGYKEDEAGRQLKPPKSMPRYVKF